MQKNMQRREENKTKKRNINTRRKRNKTAIKKMKAYRE